MSILYGGRGGYIISRNHDARPRKIIGYNHTVPIYLIMEKHSPWIIEYHVKDN